MLPAETRQLFHLGPLRLSEVRSTACSHPARKEAQHSWDGVLTVSRSVSSPARRTRCLAAGLSDSASLQPSEREAVPPRLGCWRWWFQTRQPRNSWGPCLLGPGRWEEGVLVCGGVLWPVTSVLARSLRSSRPRRSQASTPPTPTRASVRLSTSVW